jgi:YesN/AraC family two-component response regulator
MKALVVDDERMIRCGIQAIVPWERLGIHGIFTAASGKEALSIVKSQQPDIVITDIQMAEMTGIELIAAIRSLQKNIKIIVVTGYDEFDYARECLRMQVQDFLLKPVDEEVLIKTIRAQVKAIKAAQAKQVEHKNNKGQLDMFREVYREFISKINENIGNTKQVLRIFESLCSATNSYNITDQYVMRCCFEIACTVYYNYVVESKEHVDSKLNMLLFSLINAGRQERYEITHSFLEKLLHVAENEAQELVTKVKAYINEHWNEDISVAGIASYFYLSPNYFSRLFKRIANEGCNEYIVRKRIENAQYLLATTTMKIGKIAQEVGYRDTNYFSLAFKRNMGISPGQYREQKRSQDPTNEGGMY